MLNITLTDPFCYLFMLPFCLDGCDLTALCRVGRQYVRIYFYLLSFRAAFMSLGCFVFQMILFMVCCGSSKVQLN